MGGGGRQTSRHSSCSDMYVVLYEKHTPKSIFLIFMEFLDHIVAKEYVYPPASWSLLENTGSVTVGASLCGDSRVSGTCMMIPPSGIDGNKKIFFCFQFFLSFLQVFIC